MKRLSALLLLLSLFTLTAWTLEDCVEVNFDHPDCDRYPTTTIHETTTTIGETTTTEVPPSTTSSPESTTSTSGSENSTTTSTPAVSTTTTVTSDTPTTTTTVQQQCLPGMIHQPPLCLPPTTDTTSVISTTHSTNAIPPELPRTGPADLPLLALSIVGLSVLGFTALKYGRREE